MPENFEAQAREIREICSRMGVEPEQLGERAAIMPETMRKYTKGYQRASDIVMQSLRNVEKLSGFLSDAAVSQQDKEREAVTSPFRWMDVETLQKLLLDLPRKLAKATPNDRKYVLGNLRQVLDELEAREVTPAPAKTIPPNSAMLDVAVRSQGAASALARELGPVSPPSPKAGAASDRKPSRVRGTAKRSTIPPAPPAPAPE